MATDRIDAGARATSASGQAGGPIAAAATEAGKATGQHEGLKAAAKDFESIFYGMMLKSMRESIDKSGLVDGGNAEGIYQGLLDQQYAQLLASESKSGLADTIVRQLSGGPEKTEITDESGLNGRLAKMRGAEAYQSAIATFGKTMDNSDRAGGR